MLRPLVAVSVFLVASSASAVAHASTSDEIALAEELFRQAKEEMNAERWDDACPKLMESFRLDPAGGTALTLALCHEAQGRTAAAWAEFGEAIALAKRDGRSNRESIAREHLDALRPRLVRLRVVVSPSTAKLPDLVLRRDGIEMKRAAWEIAAPVDPGEHLIEASVPGYERFRTSVQASAEGTTVEVTIPPLAELRGSATSSGSTVESPRRRQGGTSALRITSYALGGAALVGFGAGAFFALDARSEQDAADTRCPSSRCAYADAVEASRSAGRSADVATGLFIGSAAVLGAAAVLFFLTSEDRAPRLGVTSAR